MSENKKSREGNVVRIAGPLVGVLGMTDVRHFDVVHVGRSRLIGEVIQLSGDKCTVQVYEDTGGLRVGDRVVSTGKPFTVTLGPGLLGSVYDGLQRPLVSNGERTTFLAPGAAQLPPLPEEKKWEFTPHVTEGDLVKPGQVLGMVEETAVISHPVLVPEDSAGMVISVTAGTFAATDTVAVIEVDGSEKRVGLSRTWPVRQPRPYQQKIATHTPLISGTRIIDTFFPVAKGGTAIIPGGFGTGKTITEHSLARWADTDLVVYIGCGERGNEMAEVLQEFPRLEDPRTGRPLMERTVLIANTSNMPVAAREASIYTGVTIAEYYRDLGYDVLLLADSTSRWGEALREISGRLEEMPGEEGYPAYLASRLSEIYERSGRVICLGAEQQNGQQTSRQVGSVTIVGAVSPPGGDFSEPITQNSLRVVGTFWALDYELSRRRHFPAINWTRSYTLYHLQRWYREHVTPDWSDLIGAAQELLQQEAELEEIVQLVGPDALAADQKAVMAAARMLREDFLQQSSFDTIDRFCPLDKAVLMMRVILTFYRHLMVAVKEGAPLDSVLASDLVEEIARMKHIPADDAEVKLTALMERIDEEFDRGFTDPADD